MTATLNPLVALDGTADLRHSNGSIRGTAEQCPPVDSNHAPPGSEPGVLSAELDGLRNGPDDSWRLTPWKQLQTGPFS